MTTAVLPLDALAQQIAQEENQLAALRKELEERRQRFARLNQRKQELEDQLRQIDADIAAVTKGKGQEQPVPAPSKAAPSKPATPPPVAVKLKMHGAAGPTLTELIALIVRAADGQPVNLSQLVDEVKRRGYVTASTNLYELVKVCTYKMVKKGILRRSPKNDGLLLPRQAAQIPVAPVKATEAPKQPAKPATAKGPGRNGPAHRSAAKPAPAAAKAVPGLRIMLIDALRQSKQPVTARELGKQVLERGYQTKSKDFTNVIWVMLGKIPEIEHVAGQGYRLKKGKA